MHHRIPYRMAVTAAALILAADMTACGTQKSSESTESTESETTESREMAETIETATIESAVDQETAAEVAETVTVAETTSETEETIIPEETMISEPAVPESQTWEQTMEYTNLQEITLDPSWEYAEYSKINSGAAVLYRAPEESDRKEIVIGINAGHGTTGGAKVKTLCHPDGSAKVTGGSTAAGATEAAAVSGGMTFQDGTPEREVTLRMAQILRDKLLSSGYDVLMLRDSEDVQLDNVARTVICNHVADCHISLHWDSGDGKNYDKGCFYISVPESLKSMEPVASHYREHDALGEDLIEGLKSQGATIYGKGHMGIDLTQTSYSTIPSVDMELGNGYSDHSDAALTMLAEGLLSGIQTYFEQ